MKTFIIKSEQILCLFLCLFIMGGVVFTYYREKEVVMTMMPTDKKVVILDAGHGGWDPGKTGTQGENEKDINLKIVQKLQAYLEQSGAVVIVTRNEDEALSQKKKVDMKNRKEIVNESGGDIFISIHQNAFPSPNVKGAQVFYFKKSDNGKILAELIQERLKNTIDPDNKRQAKENTNYYILKNTEIPAAIVECGFLSNGEEELKLNEDAYQEKVAWAIYLGIIDYFSTNPSETKKES